MRSLILFLFFLICFDAFSGNPVMFVRCRSGAGIVAETAPCNCDPGFVLYDPYGSCMYTSQIDENTTSRTCYPAPTGDDGRTCPDGMVLDSFQIQLPGAQFGPSEWIYLCVPNCAGVVCDTVPALTSDCPTASWSLTHQQCGCDYGSTPEVKIDEEVDNNGGGFQACGCPLGYKFESVGGVTDGVSSGRCVIDIIEVDSSRCFELDVSSSTEPFSCSNVAATDTVKITITGAGGNPLMVGDVIKIQDLLNCNLITNDNDLATIQNGLSGVDAAFVADSNGEIIIEFVRDPTVKSEIMLGKNQTIEVPACTESFLNAEDPCSCDNPSNILDSDGAVLYWADTLKITGTPNTEIVLTSNIGNGFLNPNTDPPTPFSVVMGSNSLGMINGSGLLDVPFYREAGPSAGATTDIMFEIAGGSSVPPTPVDFERACNIANTGCGINNPIPTLGQWSVMILGILLLILGIVGYRYRIGQLNARKAQP